MSLAGQISLFDQMQENVKIIHLSADGWVTVCEKVNGIWKQWHYRPDKIDHKLQEIIDGDYDHTNAFMTQNTFYKTYRRIETIKQLRALYIDIDCYKVGYTKAQVLAATQDLVKDGKIPQPNVTTDSGQGLYFIWTIKAVPSKALPLWRAVERYLYEQLKEYGADPKALDPTRVLRIAGTINTKTGTAVEILDTYEYKYELREIQEEYLPELKPKKKKRGRPKKVVSLYNQYSLYHARLEDLVTLCEARNWRMNNYREIVLFLYRYWSCCFLGDEIDALRQTLEINEQFTQSLSEKEAVRATKSAEKAFQSKDKQYKYKNETLIELLELTEQEQRLMRSIIGKRVKYDRNNERRTPRNEKGLTPRQQQKQEKLKQVQQLMNDGYLQREIAEIMGISIPMVKKYYAELRKV